MIWSANKPTEPGWYNYTGVPDDANFDNESAWCDAMVEVYREVDGSLVVARAGETAFTPLDQWPDGSWCAVRPPEEAE